jgi:hypothetical protein
VRGAVRMHRLGEIAITRHARHRDLLLGFSRAPEFSPTGGRVPDFPRRTSPAVDDHAAPAYVTRAPPQGGLATWTSLVSAEAAARAAR